MYISTAAKNQHCSLTFASCCSLQGRQKIPRIPRIRGQERSLLVLKIMWHLLLQVCIGVRSVSEFRPTLLLATGCDLSERHGLSCQDARTACQGVPIGLCMCSVDTPYTLLNLTVSYRRLQFNVASFSKTTREFLFDTFCLGSPEAPTQTESRRI